MKEIPCKYIILTAKSSQPCATTTRSARHGTRGRDTGVHHWSAYCYSSTHYSLTHSFVIYATTYLDTTSARHIDVFTRLQSVVRLQLTSEQWLLLCQNFKPLVNTTVQATSSPPQAADISLPPGSTIAHTFARSPFLL